jgi:hypothetical protein
VGMDHHGSGTVDSCLDRLLGAAIHVFGTNAGVHIGLVLGDEIGLKFT